MGDGKKSQGPINWKVELFKKHDAEAERTRKWHCGLFILLGLTAVNMCLASVHGPPANENDKFSYKPWSKIPQTTHSALLACSLVLILMVVAHFIAILSCTIKSPKLEDLHFRERSDFDDFEMIQHVEKESKRHRGMGSWLLVLLFAQAIAIACSSVTAVFHYKGIKFRDCVFHGQECVIYDGSRNFRTYLTDVKRGNDYLNPIAVKTIFDSFKKVADDEHKKYEGQPEAAQSLLRGPPLGRAPASMFGILGSPELYETFREAVSNGCTTDKVISPALREALQALQWCRAHITWFKIPTVDSNPIEVENLSADEKRQYQQEFPVHFWHYPQDHPTSPAAFQPPVDDPSWRYRNMKAQVGWGTKAKLFLDFVPWICAVFLMMQIWIKVSTIREKEEEAVSKHNLPALFNIMALFSLCSIVLNLVHLFGTSGFAVHFFFPLALGSFTMVYLYNAGVSVEEIQDLSFGLAQWKKREIVQQAICGLLLQFYTCALGAAFYLWSKVSNNMTIPLFNIDVTSIELTADDQRNYSLYGFSESKGKEYVMKDTGFMVQFFVMIVLCAAMTMVEGILIKFHHGIETDCANIKTVLEAGHPDPERGVKDEVRERTVVTTTYTTSCGQPPATGFTQSCGGPLPSATSSPFVVPQTSAPLLAGVGCNNARDTLNNNQAFCYS